jgi:hypothetical protein
MISVLPLPRISTVYLQRGAAQSGAVWRRAIMCVNEGSCVQIDPSNSYSA